MAIDVRETLKSFLNWRRPGGALSAAGHAAILVAGVFAFSSAQPFQSATESVPVDIVSEKDFNEMMKGDKTAKEKAAEPVRRVDRVAETKEDKDPGVEKKDTPAIPTRQEAKSEPEPKSEPKLAAIIPPVRPPELRVAPPVPTPPPPAKAEEEEDEIDEKAELLRKKKIEDQKKAEDAAKATEAKKKLDEKLKQETQAKADAQAKAAEDKRKLDEKLKAEAEAEKRTEDKKKADAEKKARDDKAKKELAAKEAAEAEKLNNAIRNKLLASRETPSSTGSTGAVIASRSTLGAANATGKKLSPSDRAQLIGILTEQMNRCISYSGTAPKTGPQLTFTLTREGGISGGVQLANRSGEANFTPFSEAAMRALRNCQPYRIPARFLETYDDWRNVRLNIDTSEMQ